MRYRNVTEDDINPVYASKNQAPCGINRLHVGNFLSGMMIVQRGILVIMSRTYWPAIDSSLLSSLLILCVFDHQSPLSSTSGRIDRLLRLHQVQAGHTSSPPHLALVSARHRPVAPFTSPLLLLSRPINNRIPLHPTLHTIFLHDLPTSFLSPHTSQRALGL